MDEDDITPRVVDTVAVVTGVVLMAAAVMAVALMAGCVLGTDAQGPVQVRLVDLDRQLDVSITQDDDSKENPCDVINTNSTIRTPPKVFGANCNP